MEPGTGKTLTTFALVDQKHQKLNRHLIALTICPKNLIGSWEDELKEHVIGYQFLTSLADLDKHLDKSKKYTYVVVNYEQIRIHFLKFLRYAWDFIILDESHRIKNIKAKITKALWNFFRVPYKVILSGTPITKDEIDLFSQFKFLNPNIWGNNFYSFAEKALKIIDRGEYKLFVPDKKKMKPFMERAAKFTYRVKLDDIAELPGMNNFKVHLDMRGSLAKAYTELQSGFMTEYKGHRSTHALNVTGLLRLQQLTGGHLALETNDVARMKEQPKLLWILDKLEDLGNEKVVIFCRYDLEIQLLTEALKKYKYNYVVMKGKMTTSATNEVRRKFKEDKKCQILIGQIQSVKEGNNFQKLCRYGIFYSKTFSHVDVDQCKKRLYRNGQTRKVVFWHLIMNNSIDVHIEKIVEKKFFNAEEALLKLVIKGNKHGQALISKKRSSGN